MFEFGEKSFIGVDIGTSTIKAVEIKIKEKKPVLSNYAWMKIPIVAANTSQFFPDVFLAECLKKITKESKMTKGDFFMSLQSSGALMTLIKLPQLPAEDMEQAIQFEAHKYIPTSLDEVSLSWGIIKNDAVAGVPAAGSQEVQVLLIAVPKNKIRRYESIARMGGVYLRAIEIESFSLVRSLIGNDAGRFIVVDIGSRVCNILLVEKGEIKISRNIDAGGKDITKAIATGLSVGEERAESLKISKMDFLGKESNIVFPCLDLITGEIKRILLSYYKKEDPNGIVDGLILSGGTASLTGLDKYFSSIFNTKVLVGNPFGRVAHDARLENRIKEIGPQFSVAVGLALKGLEG